MFDMFNDNDYDNDLDFLASAFASLSSEIIPVSVGQWPFYYY